MQVARAHGARNPAPPERFEVVIVGTGFSGIDIPSHLYSFFFDPKPDGTRSYSPQREIQVYLRACVDEHDLRRHIRFGCEVTGAAFDESDGTWTVRVAGGKPVVGRSLVLGNGALSIPACPDIPGLDAFQGRAFHSARWDHGYDLRGKRVAVIGTGASAIQFVPEIAPDVASLKVFQRTPPWILPKPDRAMTEREKWVFRRRTTTTRRCSATTSSW